MNEYFEPTLLPPNKNISDKSEMIHESVSINKSLIDKLCLGSDLKSSSCFLAGAVIVLSKYCGNESVFISTLINSLDIPLIVNDKNRAQTADNYIKLIEKALKHPVHGDSEKPMFRFLYGSNDISNDNTTTLIIDENLKFYRLKLTFDRYKYTTSYIRSFLRSIEKVINQFIKKGISNLKIEDIELRKEHERDFKSVDVVTVNELFEKQVNKNPDKTALRTSHESYTFRLLNEKANRIASALIKRGIEKRSRVAFMLPRDVNLIASFFGIIKAGCAAVPLDMDYPAEKINHILKNSGSKHIITYKSIDGAINPMDLIDEGNADLPEVFLKGDDEVCILYTSGSTGNPKGVVISHENLSNLCSVHFKKNFKSILTVSSIAFDISESDIFVSLCNGNEVILADDDEIKDIILLSRLIEKTKPELLALTPSRLSSYMKVQEFCRALRHLKAINSGGEAFRENIFHSVKKYCDIDIYNSYGPLETTFTSNVKLITNPELITVGKAFTNYITEVRDIDAKLLPYGVKGELYIGGVGVSKGYCNLETKNKSFISINEKPYYKTGDYAVQLPSDDIIIKGRIDNQIKLRGQRVETEEIENVIMKYPGIYNAAVNLCMVGDVSYLCGYFTSKKPVDTAHLKKYLESVLSHYMVPTFLIQLDEIPETPNGKTDRKNLPKPVISTDKVPPKNSIERKIIGFCRDILDDDGFGVTDNLFKMGFTSLTFMRLNSDIYHEFKVTLKHTDLMKTPTVREISWLVENASSDDENDISEYLSSDIYPMSSQQKRLYVLYRQNPSLTNYNLVRVRKFKKIDIERLENAVNKVIEAEEILRTSFDIENGEYVQKIHEKRPVKVDFIEADKDEDIKKVFGQCIHPFDLKTDPLIRIKVISHGGEIYVLRDMHHIIGDQTSSGLLYEKIRDAYNGRPFSKSPVKYKDYTLWVQNQQDIKSDYWTGKEISEVGSEIYCDFKRPLVQTFNGKKIKGIIDKKAIEKLAKKNNTTIYKLLLLQFIVLLHKYCDENTIQIGTVTSGRTHPKLSESLGMFVNTLPFIQSVSPYDTLRETLIKTEEELAGLFANQNCSMENIIEENKIPTNASYNPLFSIRFIQNTSDDFDNDFERNENKFDLSCTLKDTLSYLTVEFDYNTDLYAFEKINGLFNHYINLIDNIEENLDKKIAEINILSSEEAEMILEMSGIDTDTKPEAILDRLKRQIRDNPEEVILSDYRTSLSYHDFDLKTNSLSNYLKDKCNIKKGDTVVLIANRSIESVLAFYSILKSDAVYVPVNPITPEKRIMHIINEVDAGAVLSNIDLNIQDTDIIDLGEKSLYDYDFSEPDTSRQSKLCILHTSGTTGSPKGVEITHENAENFLISAGDNFYDESFKVFYHTTNIGFDTSLFEIIFSLLNGIRLHIIDENYDFTRIPWDVLFQKSIINTVPSKLNLFLTLPGFEKVMGNLGELILAGEALSENLVKKIRENYNPIIYNAYGPCEATIFASIKKVTDKITIGKANTNTHIYILNKERQLCPVGIPGELCIGGKQVSRGYLNKSEETSRHFIASPFSDDILYCSGDMAYLDFNGEINFIGREDLQLKINGQRVEINEINRQIEENEDINQAITVADFKKTHLHSYIVSDKSIDTARLLDDLSHVLLPFMIPSSITQIESIPINNNGKIDTEKLPQPKTVPHKYAPPESHTEKAIIRVWEKVLDTEGIGINDNFYHLGGDSIKAIRIVSLLQNEGISCNPRDILNYKTPYLIGQNAGDVCDVSYESVKGRFDLLPIQSYFFDEINRNDYTQQFILESKTDLNYDILQKALDEVINLHDMLRVKFDIKDGNIIQEILPQNTEICKINEYKTSDIGKIIKNSTSSLDIFTKLMDVSLIHGRHLCTADPEVI